MAKEIDFELKPLQKYNIECPECGKYREKNRTRTLTVYRDPPNEKGVSYVRWQCSHAGQCTLNERQWAIDPSPEDVDHTMTNETVKPLKPVGELPKTHEGNQLWWYKNSEGEPLYAVMRKNTESGKSYYPVSLQEDGSTVQLPNWPRAIGLYGQEDIEKSSKILVVEGEKTADAARGLFPGVAVVTWRGGASNIRAEDFAGTNGKVVYLWPDNDEPGRKAMGKIAGLLARSNEIYMVDTTVFPPKSDLADSLDKILVNKAIKEAKLIAKPESEHTTLEEIRAQDEKLGKRFIVGWEEVDFRVKFPSSGVVVLEGRTGHAKTGSAVNIAANVLKMGGNVLFFSYEVPASRVYTRFVGALGYPDQRPAAAVMVDEYLTNGRLKIYDQSRQIPLKKLKEILDNPELRQALIVIDYAQIVPCASAEMRNKMIDLMDSLRILANTHGFLVVLLSQLTPDYSNPLYDAPRDAKDIHFSAEMVLRVWNKDNEFGHPTYDDLPGNFVMHVIKNRDGESGHLIGFAWDEGVYLEPNGHISKAGKHKKEESRSTLALETIANILQHNFGGL